MKPSKAISLFLSVAAGAALFSQNQAIQDAAYYLILIVNLITWPFVFAVGILPVEKLREIGENWLRSFLIMGLQVSGLIYADHPLLAASVIAMWAILWGVILTKTQESNE